MKKLRISTIMCVILSVFAIWVMYMLMLPAINLRAASFYWFVAFVSIIITAIFRIREFFGDQEFSRLTKVMGGTTAVILVICIILAIVNSPLITAKTLQQIPEVKEGNFEEDYIEISNDPAEAFTLDLDSAMRLGNRAIGNIENASWYEVSNEFNLIKYQGIKYRVSPLEYGGLFKYFKANNEGIPGYVLVNDDTMEPEFVPTTNPIKYSPSAFFGHNLQRHLRMQYPGYTFTKSMYEVDEDGAGFWITGATEPHASLYAGRVVEKIILTDPFTGESTEYNVKDIPEWIDHAYNRDYLMTLAKWHYEYINGFLNSVFSKTGVYRTSYSYSYLRDDKDDDTANFYGYNTFVNKNGKTVLVTGITPANKSESNTGFLTLNTSTSELIYYKAQGAEESSAQEACESKMQNYGYKATYPVFVNVSGQATYMMALKDKAGIIQAYGFVNLKNYSIANVDKDIEIALSGYKQAMGMEVEEADTQSDSYNVMTGAIEQIYSQIISGTTYYYYVIESDIYRASATVNELQFLFEVGDEVEVKYQEESDYRIVVTIEKK